jgi:hypothetical protein
VSERIDKVVASAEEAFWETVAKECPETETGDFAPEDVAAFRNAATRAVTRWMLRNVVKYPVVGARVILKRRIDRYPHFTVVQGRGTVRESGEHLVSIRMDDHINGAGEWDNCIAWTEPSELLELADDIEIIDVPRRSKLLPDIGMTEAEAVQAYHAACLAIGMGAERPHDMHEPTLIAVRDKLRRALEECGHYRPATHTAAFSV